MIRLFIDEDNVIDIVYDFQCERQLVENITKILDVIILDLYVKHKTTCISDKCILDLRKELLKLIENMPVGLTELEKRENRLVKVDWVKDGEHLIPEWPAGCKRGK